MSVLHAQAAGFHGGDALAARAAAAPGLDLRAPPGLHEPPRVWQITGFGVKPSHGLGVGGRAHVHGLVCTAGGCGLKAAGMHGRGRQQSVTNSKIMNSKNFH